MAKQWMIYMVISGDKYSSSDQLVDDITTKWLPPSFDLTMDALIVRDMEAVKGRRRISDEKAN